MNPSVRRINIVYFCLVAITILSVGLTTDMAHSLFSARTVAGMAAILAFIKARYVMLEFMELRGTLMQRVFDCWLLIACLASMLLAFR